MTTFEQGASALAELGRFWAVTPTRQRNEATTRLQLIDRLLFECLGWDRTDCEAEHRQDGSFADYSLSAPFRVLIVEAKREGQYFELPAGAAATVPIPFFKRHNLATYRAVEQCARYCQERGAQYGAVTNGHQLVAFLATRSDGVPPLEAECLAYPSFDAMSGGFLDLWNAVSKAGIRQHGLLRLLLGATVPPPDKLSTRIPGYPGYRKRNSLQTNLEILGDLVLQDLAREPANELEFLQSCYSPSGALSQYALVSRTILETRYSSLLEQAEGGPHLTPAVTRFGLDPELLAQGLSRRPMLLVGDVGAGKTMFLRHFIRVDARDVLTKAIVLYLDLGTSPTFTDELSRFVAGEIPRQLWESHSIDIGENGFVRAVYRGDLARFERGVFANLRDTDPTLFAQHEMRFLAEKVADRNSHLPAALEHLTRSCHRQIVVFIDNVDQRPYEFQQEAFLLANSMAQTWPVTVFIALRPETFHRSRERGALAAYHLKAFTIAPPRLDVVVNKRLTYTIGLLKRGSMATLGGVSVHSPSLELYLRVLLDSFEDNRELIEFGENMCGGNIRLALEFIRTFIGSGHVDTQKIIDLAERGRRYRLPLHEFLRAVIYGDNAHYDPNRSSIVNLFDIATNDPREHFLLPLLLTFIDRVGRSQSDGFVSTDDVYRFGQDCGFSPGQVEWGLARCLPPRLLERPARTTDTAKPGQASVEASYLRITSIGAYYVRKMVCAFTYVDAIIVDTPITDDRARGGIGNVDHIGLRLRRGELFRQYLDGCWPRLDRSGLPFDWPTMSATLAEDMRAVRDRAGLPRDNRAGSLPS